MGIDELLTNAECLSVAEQLQLVTSLLNNIRHQHEDANQPRPAWGDISGIASYPLGDEDAQDWVSRSRRESDVHREQIYRS
ncbi:MAG: hypothetical protein WA902_06250 [Thermosynechococcaceae cyanobacterium]